MLINVWLFYMWLTNVTDRQTDKRHTHVVPNEDKITTLINTGWSSASIVVLDPDTNLFWLDLDIISVWEILSASPVLVCFLVTIYYYDNNAF